MIFLYKGGLSGCTIKKVPQVSFYLLKLKCKRSKRQKFFLNRNIRLFRKSILIIKPFLYYKFLIHTGKWQKMFISSSRNIGFHFGEFFMTRRFGSGSLIHFKKKKKNKNKKK